MLSKVSVGFIKQCEKPPKLEHYAFLNQLIVQLSIRNIGKCIHDILPFLFEDPGKIMRIRRTRISLSLLVAIFILYNYHHY